MKMIDALKNSSAWPVSFQRSHGLQRLPWILGLALLLQFQSATAQVPQLINDQGKVQVGTTAVSLPDTMLMSVPFAMVAGGVPNQSIGTPELTSPIQDKLNAVLTWQSVSGTAQTALPNTASEIH